jgi:ribonuclease P protein subunit POP4
MISLNVRLRISYSYYQPHNANIVLPKQNSIFTFSVPLYSLTTPSPPSPAATMKTVLDAPHIEFDLYGNQFRFRAAERAGRKFKHKETIEL